MEGNELTPPEFNISPNLLRNFEHRLEAFATATPSVAKSVHNKATADAAAVFINQIKNYEDEVEASEIAVARGVFFKFHAGLVRMCKQFTEPCLTYRQTVQAAIDKWGADERRKANMQRDIDEAKLKKEAEQRKLKEAARIEKLKGPQAGKAALSRPIIYTPPPIKLPEVENMIWKKKYTIDIYDVRLFLKALGEAPPDALINEDYVTINIPKLERLAAQRDGKLAWSGLAVYEGDTGQTQRRAG